MSYWREELVRPSVKDLKRLTVTKTREYVWRVDGNGHHWYNWITAWNVFDGDKLIVGGANGGNNTRSGYAHLDTRKVAIAYATGMEDALNGKVRKDPYTKKRQLFKSDPVKYVVDSDLNRWYDAGVYDGARNYETKEVT